MTDKQILDPIYNTMLRNAVRSIKRIPDACEQKKKMYALFREQCAILTKDIDLHFSSLYARMSYIFAHYRVSSHLRIISHIYRREHNSKSKEPVEKFVELGAFVITGLIVEIWEGKDFAPPNPTHNFYIMVEEVMHRKPTSFSRYLKVSIQHIAFVKNRDKTTIEKAIITVDEQDNQVASSKAIFQVGQVDKRIFATLQYLKTQCKLPSDAMLIDVEREEENILYPTGLIWKPDFLVDVTGISECFQGSRPLPIKYILYKFKPIEPNPYLLSGNIINYFLDQLLFNTDTTYKQLLEKSFSLYPLAFSTLKDREVQIVVTRTKEAYQVLKKVIKKDFSSFQIEKEHSLLEPTFMSPPYGIQGRLDMFHLPNQEAADIVELKSGVPFMPNTYGLSVNHYIQTLLYDLLISTSHESLKKIKNYILYARNYHQPLKFAPVVRAQQLEALLVRNDIMIIEDLLSKLSDVQGMEFFDRITTSRQTEMIGYGRDDVIWIEERWNKLSDIEKSYITGLIGMNAREHHLAKIGTDGLEGNRGAASFWLDSIEQKEEQFAILKNLSVIKDNSKEEDPYVYLRRSAVTNKLANFRVGDIIIIYLEQSLEKNVIHNQVHKSTIVKINTEEVVVRLRARQCGNTPFKIGTYWNIEPDMLDSSFLNTYQNVMRWMDTPPEKRILTLGLKPPQKPSKEPINIPQKILLPLTKVQQDALMKMLKAKDYFLLWGPPGTGKTSVMLKTFVQYIFNHTNERILLLAYTNRAVDEICEAVMSIPKITRKIIVRIGSRYGVSPPFANILLQTKMKTASTRKKIISLLRNHRIFISTVASFSHKQEIDQLVSFDRVVIDECSQLLDPMVIPIISKYEKVIMIGDHKQLPAIVVQDEKKSRVHSKELRKIGFENFRISLFERLFLRAQDQLWNWAYATLYQQGRMHPKIMEFPSLQAYHGTLESIGTPHQLRSEIPWITKENKHTIPNYLQQRVVYIDVPSEWQIAPTKIQEGEAKEVRNIIRLYQEQTDVTTDQMGVITPYRAQIAMIKNLVSEYDQVIGDQLLVDTVERFQGSAKDIIIISICADQSELLKNNKMSYDSIDRKLNVACTRAREQLIVIGSKEIMSKVDDYNTLIKSAKQKKE